MNFIRMNNRNILIVVGVVILAILVLILSADVKPSEDRSPFRQTNYILDLPLAWDVKAYAKDDPTILFSDKSSGQPRGGVVLVRIDSEADIDPNAKPLSDWSDERVKVYTGIQQVEEQETYYMYYVPEEKVAYVLYFPYDKVKDNIKTAIAKSMVIL